MHLSGILVTARPGKAADCARRLAALTGVEVHGRDEATGRIVVVQETATLEEQEEGLRRIQALPGVLLAALVEHRFAPPAPAPAGAAGP